MVLLCVVSLLVLLITLPLASSASATRASLLFLKPSKHVHASEPLYLLFSLAEMRFTQTSAWLSVSLPSGLTQVIRGTFSDYPAWITPTPVSFYPSYFTLLFFLNTSHLTQYRFVYLFIIILHPTSQNVIPRRVGTLFCILLYHWNNHLAHSGHWINICSMNK